ncbi:hypothetical protein ACWFRF_05440 [Nocardia sp. NPDC055165]|uniref:hypothetical protein n=1 Tax=Nocardia sp. NPDC060220 TaxID=3347076 RepID=UPI0036639AC5
MSVPSGNVPSVCVGSAVVLVRGADGLGEIAALFSPEHATIEQINAAPVSAGKPFRAEIINGD